MKKLSIIDADSLVYQCSKETIEASIQALDEKIKLILDTTEADLYMMFVSLGTYFRHTIDPAYKSNRRKYPSQLLWTRTLKSYLIDKHNAIAGKNVEADDLCAYFMNKRLFYGIPQMQIITEGSAEHIITTMRDTLVESTLEPIQKTLCAIDKDLLYSIPGRHFNYKYFLEDKENPESLVQGAWIDVLEEDAEKYLWVQMMAGDSADGISGLFQVGEKTAQKILDKIDDLPAAIVLKEYIKRLGVSKGVSDFTRNFKLLYLLKEDSDFFREVGYIPECSNVVEVSKPIIQTELF